MSDTIKKEIFTVTLTYEMAVNIDTGEILETRLINRDVNNSDIKPVKSQRKIVQDDNDREPKLILEDNKYRLNNAAVELLNLNSDSKLVIRYEQSDTGDYPIIGTSESFKIASGNKISKSNTVACRGSNNAELAKYGTEFRLIAHPSRPHVFILNSNNMQQLNGDENIKISEEIDDINFGIEDLVEDIDNVTEIDSNFFKL